MRSMNAEELAINSRTYGLDEPNLEKDYGRILDWYRYMCDEKDARQYLNTFFKIKNRQSDIEALKNVPDVWIPKGAGWVARLDNRGYKLSKENYNFLENQLKIAYQRAAENKVEVLEEKVKPNIQFYIRDKASDLFGEIEGLVDDKVATLDWSLYDFLKKQNITSVVANKLIAKFTPIVNELNEVLDTTDPDLKEGYRVYKKSEIKSLRDLYQHMLDDVIRYVDTSKKVRAPRKKKKPSVEKILKGLTFLNHDDTYKIASIDPTKILGAQELWTFNPKYKVLTVYRALDSNGLHVEWSKITNINEQTSFAKTVGRKTEEVIKTVLNGGAVSRRKLMDSINAKQLKVTRITKEVILLKVT